jgi:hypothetical protein
MIVTKTLKVCQEGDQRERTNAEPIQNSVEYLNQ